MDRTRPRAVPHLRAAFWLGLTLAIFWIGWGLTAHQLRKVSIADLRSFDGEIRLGQSPAEVVLPQHAQLESILVKDGQQVSAGQTLAVLDKAAMAMGLETLRRQLLVMQFARECLLDPKTAAQVDRWASGAGIEVKAQLRIAAEDCALDHQHRRLGLQNHQSTVANLSQRLTLVSKRLQLGQADTDGGANHLAVRRLVDTLLAKSSLQSALNRAVSDRDAARLDARKAAVAQARAQTHQIADLERDIAALAQLVSAPRITASQSGRVIRLRAPQGDRPRARAEIIAQIASDHPKEYQLFTWVTPQDAAQMGPQATVRFSVLGAPGAGAALRGTLGPDAIGGAGQRPGFVALQISPTPAALDALAKLDRSMALSHQSMQAQVVVAMDHQPLLKSMRATIKRTLQGFGFGL